MPKPSEENNEVVASPKHDRRQRRDFTDESKERILCELDACSERGQVGALLRRERLYGSQISDWRKQLEHGGRKGGKPNDRDPSRVRTLRTSRSSSS